MQSRFQWPAFRVFETRGQIWTLVVPKVDSIPSILTPEEARTLVADGGLRLDWPSYEPEKAQVVLAAIGSDQLLEVLTAVRRLKAKRIPHPVVCIEDPARFGNTFADDEQVHRATESVVQSLFPLEVPVRLFVAHTEKNKMSVLGYRNEGGTPTTSGMLFVNSCSWAHCVDEVATMLNLPREEFLSEQELGALRGQVNPPGVIVPVALKLQM